MRGDWDFSDRRWFSLALIGGGVVLLALWQYGIGRMWQLFILGPGAFMLFHALTAQNDDGVEMIFPGVIVSATGGLLLYQSLTSHWESWAYAWAMYPALAGFAMQYRAARLRRYSDEYVVGQNLMRYGLMALIGMAVVFEFAIFRSGSAQTIGLGLIGLGVLLFLTNNNKSSRRSTPVDFGDMMKAKKDKRKF